jgi:hypothetical protein
MAIGFPLYQKPGMHNPAIGRNAFNTSDILAYSTGRNRLIFTVFGQFLKKNKIQAHELYNWDETGFQLGVGTKENVHNPAIGRNAFNTSDILAYSTGRNRLIFTGRSDVWF